MPKIYLFLIILNNQTSPTTKTPNQPPSADTQASGLHEAHPNFSPKSYFNIRMGLSRFPKYSMPIINLFVQYPSISKIFKRFFDHAMLQFSLYMPISFRNICQFNNYA